jgi:TolA-binding protein
MPTVSPPSRDVAVDVTVFWVRHRTELLAALIVLLLGAGAFAGYRFYSEHRKSAAAKLLAQAQSIPDYQRVIDQYSGTPACASSYLLLAETQRNKQNYKEANTTLQIFIDRFPQHDLVSTARMAMAANFEAMGKPNEALSTLQRVVSNYPKSFNAPLALLSQVHLLKEKGQMAEARRVCENFLTQYRDSYLAGEASRQLRMLKPEATQPASTTPQPSVAPTIALPPNPTPGKP